MDLGIYGVEIIDPHERQKHLAETSQYWDYVDDSLLSTPSGLAADIIFYIGTDTESTNTLRLVHNQLGNISNELPDIFITKPTLSHEVVSDTDWLHEWKKHFHPIKIGKVLIVPEWDKNTYDNDIIFRIDPGSAFGTGQHATTMLCIKALEERLCDGDSVLDIGCGSGILSIISLLLGAKFAFGCDIDPAAVEVTRKNLQLNEVDPSLLEVYVGDILTSSKLQEIVGQFKYSVITANIVADVIIALAPIIPHLLSDYGQFIASGIIDERLHHVKDTLIANGFTIVDEASHEGWCCLVATHG